MSAIKFVSTNISRVCNYFKIDKLIDLNVTIRVFDEYLKPSA